MKPRKLLGGSQKRNLFGYISDELGSRIVRGAVGDGPFPIEAALSEEFGASRSVIREVVKSLAAKGLLESKTRTGIRVLPESQWNLFDPDVLEWRYIAMQPEEFLKELFEIRHMIEPEAAFLAAERGSSAEIASIEEAFGAMSVSDRSSDIAIEADLTFHRRILAAAHNRLLYQMGSLIGVGLLISYRIARDDFFGEFLMKHRDVLTEIKRRRPVAARRAMTDLLASTHDFLQKEVRARPRRASRGAG